MAQRDICAPVFHGRRIPPAIMLHPASDPAAPDSTAKAVSTAVLDYVW